MPTVINNHPYPSAGVLQSGYRQRWQRPLVAEKQRLERTSDKLNEESPYFCSQRLFAVIRREGEGGEGGKEES